MAAQLRTIADFEVKFRNLDAKRQVIEDYHRQFIQNGFTQYQRTLQALDKEDAELRGKLLEAHGTLDPNTHPWMKAHERVDSSFGFTAEGATVQVFTKYQGLVDKSPRRQPLPVLSPTPPKVEPLSSPELQHSEPDGPRPHKHPAQGQPQQTATPRKRRRVIQGSSATSTAPPTPKQRRLVQGSSATSIASPTPKQQSQSPGLRRRSKGAQSLGPQEMNFEAPRDHAHIVTTPSVLPFSRTQNPQPRAKKGRTTYRCIPCSRLYKVTCDRDQPCSRCKSAGKGDECHYPWDIRDCGACRRENVKCSRGERCTRCEELGLGTCWYAESLYPGHKRSQEVKSDDAEYTHGSEATLTGMGI